MADPVIGGLLGGVLRFIPEVFNFFDRKNQRKHELELGSQQLELIKATSATHIDEIKAQGQTVLDAAGMEALVAAIKAQGTPTGIKWVDALSSSVRPVWTYLVLLSWATVKVVNMGVSLARGVDWTAAQPIIWGSDETSMLATLMTFWFLDRVIKKQ